MVSGHCHNDKIILCEANVGLNCVILVIFSLHQCAYLPMLSRLYTSKVCFVRLWHYFSMGRLLVQPSQAALLPGTKTVVRGSIRWVEELLFRKSAPLSFFIEMFIYKWMMHSRHHTTLPFTVATYCVVQMNFLFIWMRPFYGLLIQWILLCVFIMELNQFWKHFKRWITRLVWRGRAKPTLCCNVNCRTLWSSTSRTHIAVSGFILRPRLSELRHYLSSRS